MRCRHADVDGLGIAFDLLQDLLSLLHSAVRK
jgi:hypothetical protein